MKNTWPRCEENSVSVQNGKFHGTVCRATKINVTRINLVESWPELLAKVSGDEWNWTGLEVPRKIEDKARSSVRRGKKGVA